MRKGKCRNYTCPERVRNICDKWDTTYKDYPAFFLESEATIEKASDCPFYRYIGRKK